MSDSNKKKPSSPSILPDSIVDMLVTDIFKKNGLKVEKKELPEEQKVMLRKMVDDITNQVNKFIQSNKSKDK